MADFPSVGIWQSRHSLKVLDVRDWRTDNGAQIQQWDMHGGNNQRWQMVMPRPRPSSGGAVRFDDEP